MISYNNPWFSKTILGSLETTLGLKNFKDLNNSKFAKNNLWLLKRILGLQGTIPGFFKQSFVW